MKTAAFRPPFSRHETGFAEAQAAFVLILLSAMRFSF
jgi:hypothetical protein